MSNQKKLLKAFALFIINYGKHESWCGYRKDPSVNCNCGYQASFDPAWEFLYPSKDNEVTDEVSNE